EDLGSMSGQRLDLLAVAQVPQVQIEVRSRRERIALLLARAGQQRQAPPRREGGGGDTIGEAPPVLQHLPGGNVPETQPGIEHGFRQFPLSSLPPRARDSSTGGKSELAIGAEADAEDDGGMPLEGWMTNRHGRRF